MNLRFFSLFPLCSSVVSVFNSPINRGLKREVAPICQTITPENFGLLKTIMATIDLTVSLRVTRGKEAAKVMRREGLLPAVLYGHGETPVSLAINAREFGDAMRHHGSTNLVVLKGLNDETAMIKSIQRHPYKNTPQTIDFIRVSRGEEVHVKVPIVLTGEPISVRTAEGVLVHSLIELEVAATPANIPDLISVDVSHLELNGPAMHVSEIKAPAGVRILTPSDEAVAVINLPAREEEEAGDVVAEGEEATAEASQQVPAEHGGPQGGGEGLKQENHTGNRSSTPETPPSS